MKKPGRSAKVGHPGVGSFGHLGEVLVFQEMGVKVTQVPYRGAGPALVDLLAGQVDLGPISAVVATPLVKSGKLKAYAVVGEKTGKKYSLGDAVKFKVMGADMEKRTLDYVLA